jgi:hypothetical protein
MDRLSEIEERLANATPGPWFRPLDTRSKASVTAQLPDDEPGTFADRLDIDGNPERVAVVQCATWSSGKHVRKRSGRDLELIAHAPADLAALVAVVREVAALHRRRVERPNAGCLQCGQIWPCPTAAAVQKLGEGS